MDSGSTRGRDDSEWGLIGVNSTPGTCNTTKAPSGQAAMHCLFLYVLVGGIDMHSQGETHLVAVSALPTHVALYSGFGAISLHWARTDTGEALMYICQRLAVQSQQTRSEQQGCLLQAAHGPEMTSDKADYARKPCSTGQGLTWGCTIEPPAARLYAVDPVGVDTISPSPWTWVTKLPSQKHSRLHRKGDTPRSITTSLRTTCSSKWVLLSA